MKPAAGTALGGRYRLDRLIAVGGMGEVWVAHDLSLRRNVAVKVLREEFAGDAGFLERFRTEARNAASLSHPNIAATYDYGEQSGSSYLVMELVDGEPLSDLLERRPVLPESRLLPVLAQTARALHAAHLVGVVHRDVKPGNILLGPGGRVKITDFGVSTAPDQAPMTATGMVMGTAQYLSPEQAVGRPATARSDLYSLGVVAYEALAGKRPFTGPTAVDIAVAHVNDPVPPLPPAVSAPVAALVMRLLAKDPADRPASAGALARTLDGMVGHTPPDGVPVLDDDLRDTGHRAPNRLGASAPGPSSPASPPAARPTAAPAPSAPAGSAPPAAAWPALPPRTPAPAAAPSPVPAPASAPDAAQPASPEPVVVRPLLPTESPVAPLARPGVPLVRPVASPHATPPPSYPPQRGVRDPRGPVVGSSPAASGAPPTALPGTRPLATTPDDPGSARSRPAPSSPAPSSPAPSPSAPSRSAPSRSAPSGSAPSGSAPSSAPSRPATGRASRPPTATATRPPGTRSTAGTRPDGGAPVRTSTTTGRRFGRLGRGSWPLLALVLLLVALLLAALADTVDASGQGGATAAGPATWCDALPDPGPSGTDGIMVCLPVAGPGHDDTTTDKDA